MGDMEKTANPALSSAAETAGKSRMSRFAAQRPLVFALAITLLFIALVLVSSVIVNARWPAETPGWYLGSTLGRLVSIFVMLLLVWRLGWLSSAGFTRPGVLRTWLISLLLLAYALAASAYALTGNFDFGFSDPLLAGTASIFILAHAFLEEAAFRGLILHGFVRVWGSTKRGLMKGLLVSTLFFGGMHLVYLAGEPLSIVLGRVWVASLLGILLGALVLGGKSIYPAVFFHGVLNLGGYLNLTSNGVEGTPVAWLLMGLFLLPLAVLSLYLVNFDQHAAPVQSGLSEDFPQP